MIYIRSRFFLIGFLASLFFITQVSARTIPVGDYSISVDGDIDNSEWGDAYSVVFDSYNGGDVVVYLQYDSTRNRLQCAFILDDSSYDDRDSFLIGFDTLDNDGTILKTDDFFFAIQRDFHNWEGRFYADACVGRGAGLDWENNDYFDYNPSSFPDPFGSLSYYARNMGSSYWQGEFSVYLDDSYIEDAVFGIALSQQDYYSSSSSPRKTYWPDLSSADVKKPVLWNDFDFELVEPELSVSLTSPSNGESVDSSVQLRARVTSGGSSVSSARVNFYVDGDFQGYDNTDSSGYAEYSMTVSPGSHNWYVVASKSGYIGDDSSSRSFTYSAPDPALRVSLTYPGNNDAVDSPVELEALVESDGGSVSGVNVRFYVDGDYVGNDDTNSDGYAYYDYSPSDGSHSWYAKASKSGYIDDTSTTRSFTYDEPSSTPETVPESNPGSGFLNENMLTIGLGGVVIIAFIGFFSRRTNQNKIRKEQIIETTVENKDILVEHLWKNQRINLSELSQDMGISEDLIRYIISDSIKNGVIEGEFTKNGAVFVTKSEITNLIKKHLEI